MIPAIPAFMLTRGVLMRDKPVAIKRRATKVTRTLNKFTERQLIAEGKIAPKAITRQSKVINPSSKKKQPVTAVEANYKKWANNPTSIPFVSKTIAVLKSAASMSSPQLSVEDEHNLEVLSNQAEQLLTDWFATPEHVRNHEKVKEAFNEQLAEITEAVSQFATGLSDNVVRNLNAGTGFIRAKFQNEDML